MTDAFAGVLLLQWCFSVLVVVFANRIFRLSSYNPITYYTAFHFIVFVIRPTQVFFLGFHNQFDYMKYYPDDVTAILALLIADVGLICFIAGYALAAGGRSLSFIQDASSPTILDKRSFLMTCVVLSPLLIYSVYVNLTSSFSVNGNSIFDTGGIEMTLDAETGRIIFANNSAYLVLAINMIGTLCVAFLWLERFSLVGWSPFVIYAIFRMSLGGARWSFVLVAISICAMYLQSCKRVWPSSKMLAFGMMFMILFSVIGSNRRVVSDFIRGNTQSVQIDEASDGSLGDSPDFANFEFLTYVVSVVPEQSKTYSYFTQFLELMVKPIPRILWSAKPIGPPIDLVNLQQFGNFAGRTPAAVGDGWISLGWFGVVIEMSVGGFLFGRVFVKRVDMRPTAQSYIGFFVVTPLIIQWGRDGGISIAEFLFFVLTPLLIWSLIARVMRGMESARQSSVRFSRRVSPTGRAP